MDLSKKTRNKEGQYFFKTRKIKDVYKVPCAKILILGKLLGGWYLFEILHSLFTVKISKNVKSECF